MSRGATIVFQPFDSLVFFGVGSGEYDELTCAHNSYIHDFVPLHSAVKRFDFLHCAVLSVMQCLIMTLKNVLKGTPTEQLVLSKYEKVCLVVDEIIHEVRYPDSILTPRCM